MLSNGFHINTIFMHNASETLCSVLLDGMLVGLEAVNV